MSVFSKDGDTIIEQSHPELDGFVVHTNILARIVS
jgi:hypothetical protein